MKMKIVFLKIFFETMSGVTKRSETIFLVTKERKAYRVE